MTLDEQRAICDAATPDPWSIGNIEAHPWTEVPIHVGKGATRGNCFAHVSLGGPGATSSAVDDAKANAQFFIAARTEWPALIEEHRKALAEIERLKAAGKVLAKFAKRHGAGYMSDMTPKACEVFEEAPSGT